MDCQSSAWNNAATCGSAFAKPICAFSVGVLKHDECTKLLGGGHLTHA